MNKSLYLFTAGFPYTTIENFLETEILYLSKYFSKIYVTPLAGSDPARPMPDNCILCQPLYDDGINTFYKKYKDFLSFQALPTEISEFFNHKVFLSKAKFINWLKFSLQLNRLYNSKKIKKISQQISSDDVCYFYWGVGSNLLSIVLKGKCHMVSRFHGEWDLWEEKYGGYVPFRGRIAAILDREVFISNKGKNYFDKKYPNHNTVVFPLGTVDVGISRKSNDDIIRILSCSSVYPLKRVDLICKVAEELANRKFHIQWTHIGGGQDFEKLKKQVETINNPNLNIRLLGQVSSDRVSAYYTEESVDVFINLSTSEGVPVSIMEATSCDVPIVATNVGATSEVVNRVCGVLVSPNPTVNEVADAVLDVIKRNNELTPRLYWTQSYNADVNYNSFSQMLYNL